MDDLLISLKFAKNLFEQYKEDVPKDRGRVDEILAPLIKIVVNMAAPIEINP